MPITPPERGAPPRVGRLGVLTRDDPRLVIRADPPFWAARGGVTFELDEPSHVGVFLVFTRGLVQAFYPYELDQKQFFEAGSHVVLPRLDTTLVGPDRRFGGPVLFIVASSTPLNLSALRGKVSGFVGVQILNYRFSTGNLRATMEEVVRTLMADFDAPTWTAYYYSW